MRMDQSAAFADAANCILRFPKLLLEWTSLKERPQQFVELSITFKKLPTLLDEVATTHNEPHAALIELSENAANTPPSSIFSEVPPIATDVSPMGPIESLEDPGQPTNGILELHIDFAESSNGPVKLPKVHNIELPSGLVESPKYPVNSLKDLEELSKGVQELPNGLIGSTNTLGELPNIFPGSGKGLAESIKSLLESPTEREEPSNGDAEQPKFSVNLFASGNVSAEDLTKISGYAINLVINNGESVLTLEDSSSNVQLTSHNELPEIHEESSVFGELLESPPASLAIVPTTHDLLFHLIMADLNRDADNFGPYMKSCTLTFLNRPLLCYPLHLLNSIQTFREKLKNRFEGIWFRIFKDSLSLTLNLGKGPSGRRSLYQDCLSWLLKEETNRWYSIALTLLFMTELCKNCIHMNFCFTKWAIVYMWWVEFLLDNKLLHFIADEGGWSAENWNLGL